MNICIRKHWPPITREITAPLFQLCSNKTIIFMRESNMKQYQKYEQASIEKGKKVDAKPDRGMNKMMTLLRKSQRFLLCIVAW